ncbi:pyridoxal phosphate-dependent aminotransferase [Flavobacterium wongokense]|uniref:pyridoxal phosphate-dependent aminotransferase n=1 Tax=Flavobacterium wongokense TaxID=2910674 RepID=UPI001F2AFAC9|nr:aminotransferase class I/II-fold pyridoxal phosphate-dependent enzyme [Flavobacterium sp. WG47]MCF6132468.1 aminotransferase class I/II-fold pyridoxal phosphate-dependent enzyme [Flavobacterium sp. WG47]
MSNRRDWLKQTGLGIVGLGIIPLEGFAIPSTESVIEEKSESLIQLRSNENPYGPSPLARKAFADNVAISNRYNWDIEAQIIAAIALKNNVREENILLGAGSTEILDLVAKFASLEKGDYVIPDPSYAYWTVTLDNLGLRKNQIPLTADKKINLQAMREAVNNDTKLVYICNPNNPTGTLCERTELVNFIANIPLTTLVFIDEAYLEFTTQQSLCNLIDTHPNLIITKTFSKIYGLAGARIGYAVANNKMIENLAGMQSNTNNSVSVLSKLAAIASLKDEKFIADCYALNKTAREYTIAELKKLNCECIASNTNFIYFSLANYSKDYFKLLENNNIEGTRIYEENGKWTRITIGTMKEMQQFIKAIQ